MIALLVIYFCIGSIVYCLIQLPSRNRSLLGKALQCCWATVGSTKSAWNLISKRKAAGLVSADPEAHKRQVSTKSSADRQLIYLYSSPAPNYGNEPYFFAVTTSLTPQFLVEPVLWIASNSRAGPCFLGQV